MKNQKILILIFFILLIGCRKENTTDEIYNNPKDSLELYISIHHGNNQIGEYNKLLPDSLVVKITDKEGNSISKVPIRFEQKTGYGDISPGWVLTDSSGLAYTRWTLGCNSDFYEVNAFLTDSISNKIDSVLFSAKAIIQSGWGKACGIERSGPFESFFREHNGVIYFLNYGKVYTTQNGGISWQELENLPTSSNIFDIQFNSKNWMYVATSYDGVYYTEDYKTWHKINNGFINHSDVTSFLVEDTCLFISFNFDGLYRSTDNGSFWRKLLINGKSNEEYVYINRHPNGQLYLFDKWDTFWNSIDNGDNWEYVKLDSRYVHSEIEDFIIDKNGTFYIGSGDATISILTADYYEGKTHRYYEWNSSSQFVGDIKIFNEIIYFTVNGHPKSGIYSSQKWKRVELEFEKQIYDYHLKNDGTFLIATSDGVYYYNNQ